MNLFKSRQHVLLPHLPYPNDLEGLRLLFTHLIDEKVQAQNIKSFAQGHTVAKRWPSNLNASTASPKAYILLSPSRKHLQKSLLELDKTAEIPVQQKPDNGARREEEDRTSAFKAFAIRLPR